MKKLPVVYVYREVFKSRHYYLDFVNGYIVSKAYLKTERKRYLDDGTSVLEYDVEFIANKGKDENLSEELKNNGCYVQALGATRDCVFEDYDSCKEQVDKLNRQILTSKMIQIPIKSLPTTALMHRQKLELLSKVEKDYLEASSIEDNMEM